MDSPIITSMQVLPVAGYDSMLMTLSGAHGPCFTRNLVLLKKISQTPPAYPRNGGKIAKKPL